MEYANEFPVKKMCQVFEVSRSGYYNWMKNKDSIVAKEEFLNEEITTVFEAINHLSGREIPKSLFVVVAGIDSIYVEL